MLRARQRIAGLVGTYPHRLDLRDRLAEVYRVLGQPAQAGRWTYLSEERVADETLAFERAYRRAQVRLIALNWAGRVEEAPTEAARTRLPRCTGRRGSSCGRARDDPGRGDVLGRLPDRDVGGTFVLVCFLLGIVTLVQFLWKLVS